MPHLTQPDALTLLGTAFPPTDAPVLGQLFHRRGAVSPCGPAEPARNDIDHQLEIGAAALQRATEAVADVGRTRTEAVWRSPASRPGV
jgi:hypothetical protein